MKFRPCIDIHNGKVKEIVGSSLSDLGDRASENFVSERDGEFYARLYQKYRLSGGHVILLNPPSSEYYESTKRQALSALAAWPGHLQLGGGVNPDNAREFLDVGASHVIVTSYVFQNGRIHYENLERLARAAGPRRLVLDLSCRKREGRYYIVTDRWQKFTEEAVTEELLNRLSGRCDEFLIHAVDVEGKASGIETELVRILAQMDGFPITYAGGVGSFSDLEQLKKEGRGRLDVTIGSALDLFGGSMPFQKVVDYCQ